MPSVAFLMFSITQSHLSFDSGGKEIRLDCFLPESNAQHFPAVIGLHGSGGGHLSMAAPASLLAEQGFAVYVLHYFDRTGTTEIDGLQTIFRHFPVWMKTLWDAVSFVARQPQVDPGRIGLLGFSGRVPCAVGGCHRLAHPGGGGVLRWYAKRDEAVRATSLPGADPAR